MRCNGYTEYIADLSELDEESALTATLQIACFVENVFLMLAALNCVTPDVQSCRNLSLCLIGELVKLLQYFQEKLVSTLYDVEKNNAGFLVDSLKDEITAVI